MKLYEILLKKVGWKNDPTPAETETEESKVYNPIKARVGCSVSINELDYRGLNFFLKEIREYVVRKDNRKHRFVDYVLLARPLGKEDVSVRLRLVPAGSEEDFSHRAMIMTSYDSLAYDNGLDDTVRDDTKQFVVTENDQEDIYWRVNDVGTSYEATIFTLKDENGDGKVDSNEVNKAKIEFWDYSRMTEIDGVKVEQFLFVEMNKETGWFDLSRGAEINSTNVDVI